MYVVHFVSVRGLQPPSFRLSEHANCSALRLLSHLLHLPSSDLAESSCVSPGGLATLLLPASFSLQRVEAQARGFLHATLDTRL